MAAPKESRSVAISLPEIFQKQQDVIRTWMAAPPHSKSVIGYGGSMGAGKTTLLAYVIARTMLFQYPGIHILLGRAELILLQENTLAKVLEILGPLEAAGSECFKHDQTKRKVMVHLPNWPSDVWSVLHYHPLTEKEKVQGMEYGMIVVDEANQIPNEVVEWLLSQRLRQKLVPSAQKLIRDAAGPGNENIRYLFLAASNPHPGWFEEWFWRKQYMGEPTEDKRAANIFFSFIQALPTDNPHLPPDYYEQAIALMGNATMKKFVQGRFDVFDGAVFEDFRPWSVLNVEGGHGSRWDLEELPKYSRVIAGLDLGGAGQKAHHTSGIVGILTHDNRLIEVDEFHRRGATVMQDLIQWMGEMETKWARKIGTRIQWKASKDQSWGIKMLQGTFFIQPSRGSFDAREQSVRMIQQMLQPDPVKNVPMLLYTPNCTEFEMGMRRYEYDTKAIAAGRNLTFIRKNDDMVDAVQYQSEWLDKRNSDPNEIRNVLPVVRVG